MKYPIDGAKYIDEFKELYPKSIDQKALEIMRIYIDCVNAAYAQGVKDGKVAISHT